MARPVVTIPPVTILMEMAGYGSLTEWLARPLPKEHVAKLSPDAKRTRKRAQVRLCKLRTRRARAVSNRDALTPTQRGCPPGHPPPHPRHHPLTPTRGLWPGLPYIVRLPAWTLALDG